MVPADVLNDKTKTSKQKVKLLGSGLLNGELTADELVAFAQKATSADKATCIEALEWATKTKPALASKKVFLFVTRSLMDTAPRVKWESAKVIGNTAHLFPSLLGQPIANLLTNSEDSGAVVRWASAYALAEILKLKTRYNEELIPAIEVICNREPDSAVKKKYLAALEKVGN